MSVLSIIIAPDPRLKIRAETVGCVDDEVRKLMDHMLGTMSEANGIGLAAPQVGVKKCVLVMDMSAKDEDPQPIFMADPQIVWASEDEELREEGCLSLPDYYGDVLRPRAVKVRYLDYHNDVRELDADGLVAVCVQHEMDHLVGTLFVDHMSSLKRNMILRKLQKTRRGRPLTV